MQIKGLQKTTLLDYPGKVACTVFFGGCNYRCPFCHNASLVLKSKDIDTITEEDFFDYLEKRRGILDGVCITGGEPLMQKDIIPFIINIKEMGFSVKLDTNGSFPERLSEIIHQGIVDYIAMDIKNSPEKYDITTGIENSFFNVQKSIELIMKSNIPYEFRTTVVKELHSEQNILDICKTIQGAEKYFLQAFTDSGDIIESGLSAHSENTMKVMASLAAPHVKLCEVRGI